MAIKNSGELKSYVCDWPGCGMRFEVRVSEIVAVRTRAFDAAVGKGKVRMMRTSVYCPRCGNGLPT